MTGGTDAAGHWISTLFTSIRETANFGYLTGSTSVQTQQGFAGQVQSAMELSTGFQSTVASMLAQNEGLALAQVSAANEQFLTAQMAEIGIIGETLQDSKISLGRILATGIFTGLSLLAPSLAGFNLYAISKLVGGIGTRIDAKMQNKFLAARNSMMLLKDAVEIEKPKAELGKKPISTQPDGNLPSVEAQVSLMPHGLNPLIAHNPVESNIFGAKGALSEGIVALDPTGRLSPSATRNKYAAMEKEQKIAESQRIRAHLEEIEKLDGKVSEVLADVKDDFIRIERSRMDGVIESLKGKKYGEYQILIGNHPRGGVYYKVLDIILEKSKNGETLTQLENNILDAATFIMGGFGPHLNVFELFDSYQWEKGTQSPNYPFFDKFVEDITKTLNDFGIIPKKAVKYVNFLLGETETGGLSKKRSDLRVGNYFNIREDTLDKIYVKLGNAIKTLPISGHATLEILSTLDNVFNDYYSISGWNRPNPFYRDARLMLFEIGEALLEIDIPGFDNNDFTSLSLLIEYSVNTFYSELRDNPDRVHKQVTVENFRSKLLDSVGSYIDSRYREYINSIIDKYLDKVNHYWQSQDLLSGFKDSYRKRLINLVCCSSDVLLQAPTLTSLSLLLFGNKDYLSYTFLHQDGIDSRPNFQVLFGLKLDS
jgi:hypothetical protein